MNESVIVNPTTSIPTASTVSTYGTINNNFTMATQPQQQQQLYLCPPIEQNIYLNMANPTASANSLLLSSSSSTTTTTTTTITTPVCLPFYSLYHPSPTSTLTTSPFHQHYDHQNHNYNELYYNNHRVINMLPPPPSSSSINNNSRLGPLLMKNDTNNDNKAMQVKVFNPLSFSFTCIKTNFIQVSKNV